MGSFNTSCLVSRQIIVPGAQAVILPISQQGTYNPVEISKHDRKLSQYGFAHTTCYPTAFWGYAGPMIRGTYDDYGCFDILDTPDNCQNMFYFFKKLSEDAFTTHMGENHIHDVAFNIHDIFDAKKSYSFSELEHIWSQVWSVTQENRLFVANYQGEPRNLQFAVIHHAAAQYLIDSVSQSKDYNGHSYEQKAYFKRYAQSNMARMMEIFKERTAKDMMSFYSTQIASLSNYRLGEQEGTHLSHYYDNWSEIMDLFEAFAESEAAQGAYTLPDELIDKLFELFKSQIEHRYLHVGLDSYDVKLSPMVYASQDYDNSTGRAYAKMVRSVGAMINKEIQKNRDD